MDLLKKKKDVTTSKPNLITDQKSVISYPENLNVEDLKYNSLFSVLVYTLQSVVEEKDYNEFMSMYFENFYERNKEFLENLKNLGEGDLEKIWILVNKFLSLHSLGFSKIVVDLSSKKMEIYHWNSPFVKLNNSTEIRKTCKFLAEFYSKVLSLIFDEEINLEERICANEEKGDYCIFSMA
ncbi:hypothetical protein [Sulfurihydrogenibium azorense]|uniref:hypothetical protein n=1 Tax=Sulfurihydrogenibium azorense TaxID=309806 RepID=UPI00240A75C5|nr:hypothetical protein [Sulfurihydrogenibium azorense]MDM7273787.1 hypothetical protein [Sulfurihydrogenibium azorense]